MKKALIVTTVSGFVPQFEMNNVKILQSMGYEVHYATNYHMPVYFDNNDRLAGSGIIQHQVDFVRSPFHIKENIIAFRQLLSLMSRYVFQLIHCHTPMGGVLCRLAAKRTQLTPVIYTAHGFHFYKGAPLLNWLLFYPVERWLAKYTDCIIVINHEDYNRAKKFHLRENRNVQYLPGVGISVKDIINQIRCPEELKTSLNIPHNKKIMVSVGELSKRKNHQIVIRALHHRNKNDCIYLICGNGNQKNALKKLIHKLNMEQSVVLLGYRTDIYNILSCADLFIFPSLQEGLPVALMEAMAFGLPVVCSNIRGNKDLVMNSLNGYCVEKKNVVSYAKAIDKICELNFSDSNCVDSKLENARKMLKYDNSHVMKKMKKIYLSLQ